MSYTTSEKFVRRLSQSRQRRYAVEARYVQMLVSRLDREGPGVIDPIGAAVFRDTQRMIYRFNQANRDGYYE